MRNQEFQPFYSHGRTDPMIKIDRESILAAYGDTFQELVDILNYTAVINPYDLILMDSYSLEASTLIVQLHPGMSESLIQDLVYLEFYRWFGQDELIPGPKARRIMAKKIYRWLKKMHNA